MEGIELGEEGRVPYPSANPVLNQPHPVGQHG